MRTLTGILLLCTTINILAGEDTMLTTGTDAPDFTLQSHTGDTVQLSSFKGKKNVVLIFYPGDQTPGCTKQLCEIRDDYTSFGEKDAVVFGVNPGSAESHTKFAVKNKYQFPLLIDAKNEVAKEYQTYSRLMIKRTVYVIGKNGKIAFAQRGKPPVHEIIANIPE
jgi:thioredoxin-dependent peroxiredoxin